MLWNMPYMRRTNAAFVAWILNQTNGLYFTGKGAGCLAAVEVYMICAACWCCRGFCQPAACNTERPHRCPAGYGPVDQGAFNQYYEQEIKGKPINKVGPPVQKGRCCRILQLLGCL